MKHLPLQLYIRLASLISLKLSPRALPMTFWYSGSLVLTVIIPLVEKACWDKRNNLTTIIKGTIQ